MLKTNSKKARENIRNYIINNYDADNYSLPAVDDFPGIAKNILEIFRTEKFNKNMVRYYGGNEFAAFADWAAGLPDILNTLYYYNRSAVDDLGGLLEESESEKSKYTESDAENLLTKLIYRELIKTENK